MTTSFDDDEISAAGSRPIDLYTITTPTKTYHLTSHLVDVAFGGNTYTATTMSRGNLQVAQDLTGRELVVYLPISHELVQRFCASGIPEHEVVVTVARLQQTSGAAIQQWTGFAGGISIDGNTALIRVPSLTDDAMRIRLPVIAAQRQCNHVLYDAQCTSDRASASVTTTITAINGSVITVASLLILRTGLVGNDFAFGDLIHGPTNQRRMVLASDSGTPSTLTLNMPLVGAMVGDSIVVALGCTHEITTCRDKFNNVLNFGGHPYMNATINPWVQSGLGVIQQF